MMSTEYKLTHRRTRWTDRSEGNKSREGPTRSVLKQVDARRTICPTGKCEKGLRESRNEQTTTREAATNHHIPHTGAADPGGGRSPEGLGSEDVDPKGCEGGGPTIRYPAPAVDCLWSSKYSEILRDCYCFFPRSKRESKS